MRISDWSSDVCSSDLFHVLPVDPQLVEREQPMLFSTLTSGLLPLRANYEVKNINGAIGARLGQEAYLRSEEHTSELQSLMRISYAVFCLKKKINTTPTTKTIHTRPEIH